MAIDAHSSPTQPGSPADSERLNAIAAFIRRGAPIGERGVDPRPWDAPPATPAVVDGDPVLFIDTGAIDASHAPIRRGDDLYPLLRWALARQDTWGHEEHDGFWRAVLPRWKVSGKRRSEDALAYSVAYAVETLAAARRALDDGVVPRERFAEQAASDLERFLSQIGNAITARLAKPNPPPGLRRTHVNDLAQRGILAAAADMLEAPRHRWRDDDRLPRVRTEPRWLPIARQFADFDEELTTIGDASYELRYMAHQVVTRMAAELHAAAPA